MKKNFKYINKFHLILIAFSFSYNLQASIKWDKMSDPWPWDKLDLENIKFDKDFIFGTAIAEFQNSGEISKNSTWNRWQNTTYPNGSPHIKNNQKSGVSCDFWHLYKDDIALMKKLGFKSLRFSVDWAIIEPNEGKFDDNAIAHYRDLCDELIKNDMIPMITLHHFNEPTWFADKGGFERVSNIPYFVRFSELVFKELSPKVNLWCTINEPNVYAFMGYYRGFFQSHGLFPPGKNTPLLAFQVLANLMQAHVEVYKKLKESPNGDKAQISIAYQHLVFEPYRSWNPVDRITCSLMNPIFNEVIFKFLKTGIFEAKIPAVGTINYKSPEAKFMDFIGVNYYSRVLVNMGGVTKKAHEIWTDMEYPIFAEGIYQAIVKVSELKLPIYITENGIGDCKDDRRALFIKRYLFALNQAIKDGYDVKAYYYWTFTDNFEWDHGTDLKFGLLSVDLKDQKRTLRNGALPLINIMERSYGFNIAR